VRGKLGGGRERDEARLGRRRKIEREMEGGRESYLRGHVGHQRRDGSGAT
jgi:hypothetical protein